MSHRPASAASLILLLALAGCGGSKTPVSPDPPKPIEPAVPAAPSGVRIASLDSASRTAVVSWDPSPGADRYVVEHWDTFDTGVTITALPTAGAETSMTLRDLPGAWLSLRVRAGNAAGLSSPSVPPVLFQIPVQKDVVEALFFGTGPYGSGLFLHPGAAISPAVCLEAHHLSGTMLGWGPEPIRVRAETALSPAQFAYLERALAHAAELTGGAVRASIVERAASLPDVFRAGEILVLARDDLTRVCSGDLSIQGCAPQLFLTGGQLIGARIYVRPNGGPDTMSHEVGHALLGLHHVIRVQMPARPVMSASAGPGENGFSVMEAEALRAVYGAGLRFGASRAEFQARGLIH